MDQDSLRQTLGYYQEQIKKRIDELHPMVMTIRQIEHDLGIPAEESTIPILPFLTADAKTEQSTSTNGNGKMPSLRPDEYFTKSHGEAARDYLSRVGHAIEMDNLLDALRKGGCKIGGIDPKRTLSTALLRNNWKDFIRVGDGLIGLRSFYKNAKASKPKAKQASKEKTAVQRKTAKAAQPTKVATKQTDNAEAHKTDSTKPRRQRLRKLATQTEPSPVQIALHEILKDGEFHSGSSILQAVREKVESIKPIAVYGALRNGKEFEQAGKNYRMVM